MATPVASFAGMFPYLFNFWIKSSILFHTIAVMWRMCHGGIFWGELLSFWGSVTGIFSSWRGKRWNREGKRGGIGRKKEMDYKEKGWNSEKSGAMGMGRPERKKVE